MYKILASVVMGVCFLAGCASEEPAQTATTSTAPHAECMVCKKNADLACLDVTVKANTPRADYDGKTYYFCSKECHDKFVKNPQEYVEAK